MVLVVAGLLVRNGQIFVAQRAQGSLSGLWEFPGGKVSIGETPQQGLIREWREELAISIQVGDKVGEVIETVSNKTIHLMLWAIESSGVPQTGVDHSQSQWVRIEDLNKISLVDLDQKLLPQIHRWFKLKFLKVEIK